MTNEFKVNKVIVSFSFGYIFISLLFFLIDIIIEGFRYPEPNVIEIVFFIISFYLFVYFFTCKYIIDDSTITVRAFLKKERIYKRGNIIAITEHNVIGIIGYIQISFDNDKQINIPYLDNPSLFLQLLRYPGDVL